jgi:hypothetical protein
MDKQLRAHLEQLHRDIELEGSKVIDAADRELLTELLDDLHRVLASTDPGGTAGGDEPVTARVSHAIEQFEESHPTLTATLAQLAEALGRIAV